MKALIDHIWIINQEGTPYFYKKIDNDTNNMDEQSFTGFISAMISFTNDMFSDQFDKLSFGGMDIFRHSFKIFQIVVSCKKGSNDKKVIKLIEEIGKAFNDRYSHVLGNEFMKTTFQDFNEIIETLLK